MMISVTVLTKNSERHLHEVLDSLVVFDEVVIFDTGSLDSTLSLAKNYSNVVIFYGELKGFGDTHNQASSLAKNDWILSIDSDEIVSKEMIEEIHSLTLDPDAVYAFPRKNYFNGKWIKHCGWHPDYQVRLYHRKKTRFDDARVHESVIKKHMKQIFLKGAIKHYSYHSIEEFLSKMQMYSSLFAEQNAGKKRSSVFKAVLHGTYIFFRSYVLKRGFLNGSEGFIISAYNSQTAYYKYLKLYQANQSLAEEQSFYVPKKKEDLKVLKVKAIDG